MADKYKTEQHVACTLKQARLRKGVVLSGHGRQIELSLYQAYEIPPFESAKYSQKLNEKVKQYLSAFDS